MLNNFNHIYKIFFILFTFLLTGCTSLLNESFAGSAKPTEPGYTIPTRSLLVHGEVPSSSYRVNGFVIFVSKPLNEKQYYRYLQTCHAYVNTLNPTDSYSPENDLLPTYWPVSKNIDANCIDMVLYYDYIRASEIIARFNVELSAGIGPYLVASGEGEVMVLDMSTFSQDDITRAMRIWKQEICVNPKNWEPKLSIIKFREVFRNMLQAYGDSILKYFS